MKSPAIQTAHYSLLRRALSVLIGGGRRRRRPRIVAKDLLQLDPAAASQR